MSGDSGWPGTPLRRGPIPGAKGAGSLRSDLIPRRGAALLRSPSSGAISLVLLGRPRLALRMFQAGCVDRPRLSVCKIVDEHASTGRAQQDLTGEARTHGWSGVP